MNCKEDLQGSNRLRHMMHDSIHDSTTSDEPRTDQTSMDNSVQKAFPQNYPPAELKKFNTNQTMATYHVDETIMDYRKFMVNRGNGSTELVLSGVMSPMTPGFDENDLSRDIETNKTPF